MSDERPNYSKENPPPSCLSCYWHGETYSPTTGCHTYWYDYCKNIQRVFAKMHIILRGEYRSLAKHDEEDLKLNLPFECPYFDFARVFWESYGVIKMDYEIFIFECDSHTTYDGYYVYGLKPIIDKVISGVSVSHQLHYLYVLHKDEDWFTNTFGYRTVLLSPIEPSDWVYPIPPEPV